MSALLDEITVILGRGGIADTAAEAALIVQAANASTPSFCEEAARGMAERRATGVPLAYVTGHKVFMGVDLIAAEGALVPLGLVHPPWTGYPAARRHYGA